MTGCVPARFGLWEECHGGDNQQFRLAGKVFPARARAPGPSVHGTYAL